MNNKTNKNNETNELNNKTNELNNELNIYDVAIRMVSGANQYERSKIAILADEIRVYIESQAEVGLLSDADLYYIVNSILSETINQVIEWDGSTEYLRAAVVEPIERAYKAAIESLVEDMGLNGLNGLDALQ